MYEDLEKDFAEPGPGETSGFLYPETREYYVDVKQLPDGRFIGTMRLLFHWTIHVDIDPMGYWRERYCYATYEMAKRALDEWDGLGDPDYWHKHPDTGRRRDPVTGRIWYDR